MQSIDRSMTAGFTRMGADMMVVPQGVLTNITCASHFRSAQDFSPPSLCLPPVNGLLAFKANPTPLTLWQQDKVGASVRKNRWYESCSEIREKSHPSGA